MDRLTKEVYSLSDLREMTGFSNYILRRYRKEGKLKEIKGHKPTRFTKASVTDFLDKLEANSND